MARQERILSARGAMAITKPGRHSDGGGLYLYLSKDSPAVMGLLIRSAKWVLAAFQTTLAEARDLRDKWRKVLMDGRNPIEARRSGTGKAGQTFGLCVAEFLATKSPQWRNAKHQGQWRRTLEGYAAPLLCPAGHKVDTGAALAVLTPIWQSIPETASRLRGRVEAVLDFAKARGWRSGENPAARTPHEVRTRTPRAALGPGAGDCQGS